MIQIKARRFHTHYSPEILPFCSCCSNPQCLLVWIPFKPAAPSKDWTLWPKTCFQSYASYTQKKFTVYKKHVSEEMWYVGSIIDYVGILEKCGEYHWLCELWVFWRNVGGIIDCVSILKKCGGYHWLCGYSLQDILVCPGQTNHTLISGWWGVGGWDKGWNRKR